MRRFSNIKSLRLRFRRWLLERMQRTWVDRLLNDLRQMSWFVFFLGAGFFVVGILGVIEGPIPYLVNPHVFDLTLADLHQKLASDFLTIGITVIIIDTANRWRELQQHKQQLIRQMGSIIRDEAIAAAEALAENGWLFDGALTNAYLTNANLDKANLLDAALEGATLRYAKLGMAKLRGSNLQRADMEGANLEQAEMRYANLQEASLHDALLGYADLHGATLKDARLGGADFRFANLSYTNLQGATLLFASLEGARLEGAILPDGTEYSDGIDLTPFLLPLKSNYNAVPPH